MAKETGKAPQPKVDYTSHIRYEEELIAINNGSGPIVRRMNKTPYLDHNGYKVYLSRNEYETIMAGKLNPEDILKNITEELTCKYWL